MINLLLRLFGCEPHPLMEARAPGWPAARAAHLRAQGECQFCGATKGLEVHHVVPVHVDPERELDPLNLLTLCGDREPHNCHLLIGHLGSWLTANPDVVVDCLLWQKRREAVRQ